MAGALGALADQKRQAAITILDERLEHRAVGGDHAHGAVLLPQRKGLPLGDADLQPIRIKLEHRRVGDPGIGHQPRPRRVGIEEQQRGVPGHAGDGQHLFAADFLRPGERNGGNAKAGGVGGLVAGVLEPIDDIGDMAAGDGTVAERRDQQKNRTGNAKSAWRQPGDPHAAAVDPRPIRREPGDAIEPVAQRRKIEPSAQPIFPRARTARRRIGRRAKRFRPCSPLQPRPHQRLVEASSTIHFTSSSKVIPAYAASSGTSEVSVMPGCVLISRQTSFPVPRSS